jgi:hypothetical protein
VLIRATPPQGWQMVEFDTGFIMSNLFLLTLFA